MDTSTQTRGSNRTAQAVVTVIAAVLALLPPFGTILAALIGIALLMTRAAKWMLIVVSLAVLAGIAVASLALNVA